MKLNFKNIGKLLSKTFQEWNADDPFRQSAIIAYYAIFSIPGLLMIVIWAAGLIFGEEAVRGEVSAQIQQFMGEKGAEGVEQLLSNKSVSEGSLGMKIIGIGALVYGATTLFFQLQKTLNYIWEVEAAPDNNIKKLVSDRASSLGLILIIAFLLLISLVLSGIISIIGNYIADTFGSGLLVLIQVGNFIVSVGIITLLFAIMYKYLPDVDISWSTVWMGAFVTAILFSIGKTLLGLYFGYADPSSSFGAAGTVILVMIWVNYSCLILFFGAEFTQVYARQMGYNIRPSRHAKWRPEMLIKKSGYNPEKTK